MFAFNTIYPQPQNIANQYFPQNQILPQTMVPQTMVPQTMAPQVLPNTLTAPSAYPMQFAYTVQQPVNYWQTPLYQTQAWQQPYQVPFIQQPILQQPATYPHYPGTPANSMPITQTYFRPSLGQPFGPILQPQLPMSAPIQTCEIPLPFASIRPGYLPTPAFTYHTQPINSPSGIVH